ncbi:MAG: hypothetical protein OHK0056_06340 [Bacteriovoracaceae bacterium]
MKKAPIPKDDEERLKDLYRYRILDSEAEKEFDDITWIAAIFFKVKTSLISLVDRERQWFKSKVGIDVSETPRDISWCGHAIESDDVFVVNDSTKDERFRDNPLCLGEPHVIFYAGAPLITPNGFKIGTLCLIDDKPRDFREEERGVLSRLASQVVSLFELRYQKEKMRLELERQEMILEGANLGVWDWWIGSDKVIYDRRWCSMLGLNYETTPQLLKSRDERVHPDDRPQVYADIKLHLEGKTEYYENVHRLKHANGTWRWILDRGKVSERDANGKPVRLTGTHFDITEEKNRQFKEKFISEIRANFIQYKENKNVFFDNLLSTLLNHTESEYGFIGEILTNVHGKKYLKTYALTNIAWNDETKKFYEEQAPGGLEFTNLNTLFGEVIITGNPLMTNDARNHPKAGGIPIGHPALDKFCGIPFLYDGKIIAMAGLANRPDGYDERFYREKIEFLLEPIAEIIHRVKIENELEQNKQILNHNAKLASIGQLSAGISHEINNPLSIISGNISFIKKDLTETLVDRNKVLERVQKIQNSMDRISKIVNGLKNFARIDSTEFAIFNLYDVADEVFSLLKHIFESEGVTFNFEAENQGPFKINGNRGRIEQVIVNLLTNAKDAVASQAKPVVTLTLMRGSDDYVYIKVSDNGMGISKDIKDKIFDPFFTTKEVSKGTGIGLSVVSSIIQEHAAKIEVESTINVGTTFTVGFKSI